MLTECAKKLVTIARFGIDRVDVAFSTRPVRGLSLRAPDRSAKRYLESLPGDALQNRSSAATPSA